MSKIQAVVRARRNGTSWSHLKKISWPENFYNFKEGELGLLRLTFAGGDVGPIESYVPMVKWDDDRSGNYVTVSDFQSNIEIVGLQDEHTRRFTVEINHLPSRPNRVMTAPV